MNGVGLKGTDAGNDLAVERFARQFHSLVVRQGWMEDWKASVVRHNLVAVGARPDHDLPLADYLDLVTRSSDPTLTSGSAFARMIDSLDR
jgi:hypothetical protein